METWRVTAVFQPGWRKCIYPNSGGGFAMLAVPGAGSEFYFTVYAETGDDAVETVRHSGYFCGGIDAKFVFSVERLALLDAERVTEIPGPSEPSEALALGDGSG